MAAGQAPGTSALSQYLGTHCRPDCPRTCWNTIDLAREGAVPVFGVPATG